MRLLAAGLLAATVLSGCGGPSEAHVDSTQVGHGIAVRMKLTATDEGLSLDTRIQNLRSAPVALRQDGCGHVGVAEVARTTHQPRGRTWTGSVQALKRFVLEDQATTEAPEALASTRQKCDGKGDAKTLTLKPGAVYRERWVTAFRPSVLDFVGSKHAVVRFKVFEPDKKAPTLQLARPVSSVANWKVAYPEGRSDAQRFDDLLSHPALRRAIAAEPATAWREASLSVARGTVKLKALSARYERAFLVTEDGSGTRLEAPGPADRIVPSPRTPADLPPGIHVTPEPDGYVAGDDVLAGALELPSGRLAIDSRFSEQTPIVDERARPGAHPFRVTLAHPVDGSEESVALATLLVSDRRTVRWRYVLTAGVDGDTAMFSSAEGARLLAAAPPEVSSAVYEADVDAIAARRFVAERPLGKATNLMAFSTAGGDGGYDLYVGLDAAGKPTRFVLDCELLHLAWPKAKKG